MNKAKLNLQIDRTDYNMMRLVADKEGLSLSDWVRRTLNEAVQNRSRVPADSRRLNVIDKAFEHMDATEPSIDTTPTSGNVIPPAPMRAAPAGRQQRQAVTYPTGGVGSRRKHPCLNLRKDNIPTSFQGQCQGTCSAPEQNGRVCFWPAAGASGCPLFRGAPTEARPR